MKRISAPQVDLLWHLSLRRAVCTAALVGLLVCGSNSAGQQGITTARTAPAVTAQGQLLAGRVVSSVDGHGIPNAQLTLAPQVRNGRRSAQAAANQTAQTDAEGRYSLLAPGAGRYTLRATASGYLGAFYLQHENLSSAIVTGAELPTDHLDFNLVPEASLHGRILDDTGEPVRANVMLYRDTSDDPLPVSTGADGASRMRIANSQQTDEDGQYDFTNVRPGRYYVAVTATPWYAVHPQVQANEDRLPYRTSIDPALNVAYPTTFYPHATTEQGAAPIALKPGSRASANIVLQAEPALTLTVQMPPSDGAPQGGRQQFPMLFSRTFGTDQGAGSVTSSRVGDTVILSGLAPGQYTLRSMGRVGDSASGLPVSLSSGPATVSLPVSGEGSTSLDLTLRSVTGATLDGANVLLRRPGNGRFPQDLSPGKVEGGVAHFADVPPGQYRVVVQQEGETWNVNRLSVGGKAVASRLLRVDGGTPGQVEVTVARYSPEVDGEVHARDGHVHPGSLVVLVPAGADTSEDLFRADQSDLDGGFQFLNVLPGNYLLIALDNHWKLNWRKTAELMPYLPQALPVTVPASGTPVIRLADPAIVQQN
ncbi:carboxypeptidase regulatory-like domain-containing protein [Terriglobus aquaticus]|uniref:Carboxypeptidase regulatory-like domain-containing protein n=1 Tax=Terriglobus aquaticus TaxID=940139 RepID=A0ABW9KGM4_9BACT|nr:carboxypeptidase regulatory-like domain-containing protein [Terriglobus aquaticus]